MNSSCNCIVLILTILMGLACIALAAPVGSEASRQSMEAQNCTNQEGTLRIMCNTVFYLDLINGTDSTVEYESMANYLQDILTGYEENVFSTLDCLCGKELDGFREFCLERFYPSKCN